MSELKTETNRANAQHSTGPRTPEGKQNSSKNALKHGLTAQTLHVFPHEKQIYADLEHRLYRDIHPQGPLEHHFFAELLRALFHLTRIDYLEAALYAASDDPCLPMNDPSIAKQFDSSARHRNRLQRMRNQALKELRTLQTTRAINHLQTTETPEQNKPKYTPLADPIKLFRIKNALNQPKKPTPPSKLKPELTTMAA